MKESTRSYEAFLDLYSILVRDYPQDIESTQSTSLIKLVIIFSEKIYLLVQRTNPENKEVSLIIQKIRRSLLELQNGELEESKRNLHEAIHGSKNWRITFEKISLFFPTPTTERRIPM